MASLVLSTVGNMILPGLGGVIGGYVGGIIDRKLFGPKAPKTYGPRLGDLTLQTSTEGASLPIVYGTMRIAGNVIWSTGLTEASKTEESGGDGSGGGGGSSHTTYTYSTDCAVALCEGTISGIRRIWADSKLIYNVGSNATLETLQASNKNNIRFYTGSETQLCDPLIQAVQGTDLAYRGTAYAVFEDFQLADYGNRLPNFSFEVVKNGSSSALLKDYKSIAPIAQGFFSSFSYCDNVALHLIECQGTTWLDWVLRHGESTAILKETRTVTPTDQLYYVPGVFSISDEPGRFVTTNGDNTVRYQGYELGTFVDKVVCSNFGYYWAACKSGTNYLCARGSWPNGKLQVYYNGINLNTLPQDIPLEQTNSCCGITASYLYYFHPVTKIIYRFDKVTTMFIDSFASGIANPSCFITNFESDTIAYATDNNGYVYRLDMTNTSSVILTTIFLATALYTTNPPNPTVFKVDNSYIAARASYITETGVSIYTPGVINTTSPTLKSVADDITTKSRLPSTSYTYTALNDQTVKGFVVSKVMSAKAALDSLQAVYNFELVEEAGKITAINKANATNKATLTHSTIGAEQI